MYNDVYIIMGLELGWDCIVAVYDATLVTREAIEKEWPKKYN